MTEATPLLSPHSSSLVEVTFQQHGITKGLGTLAAAILVAGTMAGTGILALPGAVLKTGRNYLCNFGGPLVKLIKSKEPLQMDWFLNRSSWVILDPSMHRKYCLH